MAETAPAPREPIMGKYDAVNQVEFKNGAHHLYGVNAEGKKAHISYDSVLEAYGFDAATHMKGVDKLIPADDPVSPATATPEATPHDKYADASIDLNESRKALDDATKKFHESNGRGKFDAARDMDKAKKAVAEGEEAVKKTGLKAKVENMTWTKRVKVVSDYQEIMDDLKEKGPRNLTPEEQAIVDHYDELEASQKKIGKPLSELVTDDDIRYYRKQRDEKTAANADEEKPTEVLDPVEAAQRAAEAKEYASLGERYVNARNEYARLAAGRSRRLGGLLNREFSRKALAEARRTYELAQDQLCGFEVEQALHSGITRKELDMTINGTAAEAEWSLAGRIREERMIATGRMSREKDGSLVPVEPKNRRAKLANKFYDWWGKLDGKSGALAKTGMTMGAGVVIGAAGGIIAGPLAAGALGTGIALKITKGFAFSQLHKKADGIRHAEFLDKDLERAIWELNRHNREHFGDNVDAQTKGEVSRNRRRVGAAAVTAALGGVAGHFAGNALGIHDVFHNGGHHGGSNSHPKVPGGYSRPASAGGHPGTGHSHNGGGHHSHHKPQHDGSHTVSAKTANGEYVATAYEHADGFPAGFDNMTHVANQAIAAHQLNIVYPHPGDLSDFHYETPDGLTDTDSILKVLSKFGGNVRVR